MTKEQIRSEALALDTTDRAALAEELVLSLNRDDSAAIDAAWALECKRRIEAVDTGKLSTRAASDVIPAVLRRIAQ